MPKRVNDVLALIRRISGKTTALDMLLEFEKTLDHVSLYAYKNWISGELVQGPDIDRYWFKTTWMYPIKMMPDPEGALRLIKYGCKVYYAKDTFIQPDRVLSPEDAAGDMTTQPKKAKMLSIPVWLVVIEMPRKFIDDAYDGILEFEDEEVDIEDINAAWDEEITGDAPADEDEEDSESENEEDKGMM
jgi:hypothetical protein